MCLGVIILAKLCPRSLYSDFSDCFVFVQALLPGGWEWEKWGTDRVSKVSISKISKQGISAWKRGKDLSFVGLLFFLVFYGSILPFSMESVGDFGRIWSYFDFFLIMNCLTISSWTWWLRLIWIKLIPIIKIKIYFRKRCIISYA